MKKVIIAALSVGAMVLAGCTKTEVTDIPDSRYIGFDNAFIGNPTKAVTETVIGNLESFTVYGGYETSANLFGPNGTLVSQNSNGEWTYSPLVPWEDAQTYNFYAYSKLPNGTVEYVYDNFQIKEVKVDATNQTDFVYAATKDVQSGSEGTVRDKVHFSFNHMFSMVQFTIKSGFAEDVAVGISDFKFYGMNSKSTLTDGAWAAATDQILVDNAIVLKNENAQASKAPVDYVDNCVVMPQAFENGVVFAKFTVTLTSTGTSLDNIPENERTAEITAAIPKDTWERGYRYNYIVTIDGQNLDYITFDEPEVSTWGDENINLDNTL